MREEAFVRLRNFRFSCGLDLSTYDQADLQPVAELYGIAATIFQRHM